MITFVQQNPNINFEIEVSDRVVDLVHEQMNMAIRVQKPKGADCVFRKLIANELIAFASPAYLQSAKQFKKPSDLIHHSLLTLDAYRNCRFLSTREKLLKFEGSRKIRPESGVYPIELALRGAGIAIRSRGDVEPLIKSGQLVPVLTRHPLESFGELFLVTSNKKLIPKRVQHFLEFLLSQRWS